MTMILWPSLYVWQRNLSQFEMRFTVNFIVLRLLISIIIFSTQALRCQERQPYLDGWAGRAY